MEVHVLFHIFSTNVKLLKSDVTSPDPGPGKKLVKITD